MCCLLTSSVDILVRHQSDSGAIVAAPCFEPYKYCWLRDGTFAAHALNGAGKTEHARAFHRFIGETIIRYRARAETAILMVSQGEVPGHDQMLHTRYKVNGYEGTEPWGNFQLDGYGTWLWGVSNHYRKNTVDEVVAEAAAVTVRYLVQCWSLPCFDPWEEYPERLHVATLGAIYGGLKAAAQMAWLDDHLRTTANRTADLILSEITARGVRGRVLTKWLDDEVTTVDAAMLWNIIPFQVAAPGSEVMLATVRAVERDLMGGGVKRYVTDTYYGGGEWIITTCWLAMCKRAIGEHGASESLLSWVEGTADSGQLPEQVADNLTDTAMYEEWVKRWGPIASPLLWSHAMYIIARAWQG